MIICTSNYKEGSSPYAISLEAKKYNIPCEYHTKNNRQIKKGKYIAAITNNGSLLRDLSNIKKFNTQHGQSWLGDAQQEDWINYYLMASEWMKDMFIRNGFNKDKLIVTGQPRLDFLYKTLQNYNPDDKKTIIYAPTWERMQFGGGTKGIFANWFSDIKTEIDAMVNLIMATIKYGANLIIRLHSHYARYYEHQVPDHIYQMIKDLSFISISSMITNPDSFNELIKADLLITDYSSIATDFLALDRPVAFIKEGCGWVYNNTGKWFLMPDERYKMGEVIEDYKDFDKVIYEAFSNPEKNSKVRQEYFEKLHGKFDGKNSKRALKAILEGCKK